MYNETILEHFKCPRNVGRLPEADGAGAVGDPSCGDYIVLYIKVQGKRLVEVGFELHGGPGNN